MAHLLRASMSYISHRGMCEARSRVAPHPVRNRTSTIAFRTYGGARRVLSGATSADSKADADGYKMPSKSIVDLLDTPVPPSYMFSPDRTKILKVFRPPPNPPITEFIQPELKLAGLRIDAAQSSRSRLGHSLGMSLLHYDLNTTTDFISELPEIPLKGVPKDRVLNYVRWSPNGVRVAFTVRCLGNNRAPLELYVAEVPETGKDASSTSAEFAARPILGDLRLNSILHDYDWLDDDTIVAAVIPSTRGEPPEAPAVPLGPKVSDNSSGKKSQARTYPDLLKSKYDEDLFEWHLKSELVSVDVRKGAVTPFGPPRMYADVNPSPDDSLMIVSWIERPFSYELPVGRFPRTWQVWDRQGKLVREVASIGLLDSIPIEFDATRMGPRQIGWRADKGCTLKWIEAQDEGDPKNNPDTSPRDIMYAVDLSQRGSGSGGDPEQIAATDLRCGGIAWCDGEVALLYESWWATRRSRVWVVALDDPFKEPELLFDRSYEDIYSDPGAPLYVKHPELGTSVLARVDGERKLLMMGEGASKDGTRPFMDVLPLDDPSAAKRVWQSSAPYYESPIPTVLNEQARAPAVSLDDLYMLVSRETTRDPPQIHVASFSEGGTKLEMRQLTNEPHPTPQLRDLQREILQYKRADGVSLNAELFLPPHYDPATHGRLPCILWAYPREYKSKEAAGQLDKSPYEFTGIGPSSPLVWLARGYAVLSGPSLPIVAEGDEEPNDTYVQQLVDGVTAAIDEVIDRGIVDGDRIACGGHSYGAFMTANILAHCGDRFACGLAHSGAYNRTLTPFGFQAEQRTFWKAPEVYAAMAPFNNADKIKKPMLLVHGEADNNTGTFPMQSERMYSALQGHGCVTRLVLLPHESHGYRAHESVMHVLHEDEKWLQAHCPSEQDTFEPGQ